MLDFLDYKNWGKVRNNIELVSVHIPKTAGTSFRNMLKAVYGDEQVARLDIDLIYEQVKLETVDFKKNRLPRNIKVIHGHFSPGLLLQKFRLSDDVPFITWLRHPVDRVISNFYYLEKRLLEELENQEEGLQLVGVLQRDLLEYAAAEINCNRIHKFLAGKPLDTYAFVGIQEYFEEDVAFLANQMGWDVPPLLHQNKTGKSYNVSPAERDLIASYNQEDMKLYEAAMQWRQERLLAT